MQKPSVRQYPVGAEVVQDGVSFRVWATGRSNVSVVVDGTDHVLTHDRDGYFAGVVSGLGSGTLYRFRLDSDQTLYPDPASRSQPEGPAGPSQVVDPAGFAWSDAGWGGLQIAGQVLYEMHVGTFTPEGTWAAAAEKLAFLKDVGITAIEMMPVNEFSGRFGWGYDGVDLFAPSHLYGTPDELRAFIDRAHALGIGVILDVVYNHLGPDANFLPCFSKDYFTDRYATDWGAALNFDGPNAIGMRDFVISNATYWIKDFHFDGLRLDATQSIFDASGDHIVTALGLAAREAAAPRQIIIVAENEPQLSDLVRPIDQGGFGLDAVWNDDLHHSATVALTGHNEFYYEDYEGQPQEFISAAKYGYLFQGQSYANQNIRRGIPGLGLSPEAFVTFLQNHDQVANSGQGLRFHQLTSPAQARAMTALVLLMPGTPMLFQGQEFWASTPFFYFADHKPDLARMVKEGRSQFLAKFPSLAGKAAQARLADPDAEATFRACKLDWREAEAGSPAVALHRDLLRLRAGASAFRSDRRPHADGAVLSPDAFLLRFFGQDGDDRILVINLGRDINRRSFAEPLLAPPKGQAWALAWSSEDPAYAGAGITPFETEAGLHIPGRSALVLAPAPSD